MAITSIGTDLVDVARIAGLIEKRGDAFLNRIFTERERGYCDAREASADHYAARFAAKEAVMKVLGTGWSDGVRWLEIEVVREGDAGPRIELSGRSAARASELGIERILVSLSHDAGMALAFCVATG